MSNHREVIMVLAAGDTDRRVLGRVARRTAASLAICAVMAAVSGCNSQNAATQGPGGGGPHGGSSGTTGSCLHNEPGCECAHEGVVIQCGTKAGDSEAGTVKCSMGAELCENGKWSSCETDPGSPALQAAKGSGLKLVSGIQIKGLAYLGDGGTVGSCSADPCDPYCIQYPDNANGIDAGEGGVTTLGCGEASVLTVVTSGNPDATAAPASVLKDAGLADGEGYIFIDLPPNATATRVFTTPQTTLKNVDIYFLVDDGSEMGAAVSNLGAALTSTTGIISEIKGLLSSGAYFGVGRFEDYFALPYAPALPAGVEASSTNPYNVPYQNLLSLESEQFATNGLTAAAVNWLTVDAFDAVVESNQYFARSGGDVPESSVSALWAAATGNGLWASGTASTAGGLWSMGPGNNVGGLYSAPNLNYTGTGAANWYQVPRLDWLGTPVGSTAMDMGTSPAGSFYAQDSENGEALGATKLPCTGTSTGYPCFVQGHTPVFILLSGAPSHNGPGGQYPYVETLGSAGYSPALVGANPWPAQPGGACTATSQCAAGQTCTGNVCTGCPTGYGGPVDGAGSMCQLLQDASGNTGNSFLTAMALPTGPNGLPWPGVYFGVAPNGLRTPGTVSPSTGTGSDWWSASSVGQTVAYPTGGIIGLPSIVTPGTVPTVVPGVLTAANTMANVPGRPQRSSLRDCSAVDVTVGQGASGDQCTPGWSGSMNYGVSCLNNKWVAGTGGSPSTCTAGASGVAASNSTYTITPSTVTATSGTLLSPLASTAVATANSISTVGAAGNAASLLTISSTISTLQTVAATSTPTAFAYSSTPNASYTVGDTATTSQLAATIPPYKIPITTGTYTIGLGFTASGGTGTGTAASITLTPGQEISNVVTTVTVSTGYNAVVTTTVLANGASAGSSGVATPGTPSTWGGPYYAGAASIPITFTVNQNASGAYSTAFTGSPSEPIYYVEVAITYTVTTPAACATGGVNGPVQYSTAGSSPTAQCPVCSAGELYSTTSPATGAHPCVGPVLSCPTSPAYTLFGSTCYYCAPTTVGGGFVGSPPTACATGCNTAGYIAGTGASSSHCYECTTGTISGSNPATCTPTPYTCVGTTEPTGTVGSGANASSSTCYLCPTGSTIVTTTNPWTCTNTCPANTGALSNWQIASATATTCYSCSGTTWVAPTGNTGYVYDPADHACLSCNTTASTPAGPVGDTLFGSTTAAPFCAGCPSVGDTVNGAGTLCTAGNTLLCSGNNTPAGIGCTQSSCLPGYTLGGGNVCTATSACSSGGLTAAQAQTQARTDSNTPNATATLPSGGGCGGNPACFSETASVCLGGAGPGTPETCTISTVTNSTNPQDVCTCQTYTYVAPVGGTAGTETVATCPGGYQAATYNGSSTYPANDCSTNTTPSAPATTACGAAGNTCAGTACTGGAATLTTSGCAVSASMGGLYCVENSVNASPGCAGIAPTNVSTLANPQDTGQASAGDGYFGNDQIFQFTVPAGSGFASRYYYHFALLRQAAYAPATGSPAAQPAPPAGALTGAAAAGLGTMGSPWTVGTGAVVAAPFLYLKTAGGFAVSPATDPSYPYTILGSASANDPTVTPAYAGPNGPVLDCNKRYGSVAVSGLLGSPQPAGTNQVPNYTLNSSAIAEPFDYVISEIDGYVPEESTPTTYYLVVDNAAPQTYAIAQAGLPNYQYFLQIGGFDDTPSNTTPPSFTQPSYNQTVAALKGMQANFVGVENSGLSCLQPGDTLSNTPYDQFETRDFMDKLAFDVGSSDCGGGGAVCTAANPARPYVVPVRPDGTACNPTCPATATGLYGAAGNVAGGSCAAWGAAVCGKAFPNAPLYDASTKSCTVACTSNDNCPMNTPLCTAGQCTTGCPGGVAGLSCAVASAVTNLTSNLKQNVYLRPTAPNANYVASGAVCTRTTATSPVSAQCSGALNNGGACYGGTGTSVSTCTSTCNVGDPACASGICEASTIVGDNNKYCISAVVFVQSVQAVSTNTPVTGSQTVCGVPSTITCATNTDCATTGYPTCNTNLTPPKCVIADTGPDTVTPLPSYYQAGNGAQDNDGMFNYCSPGSEVNFAVTFQMPFQRSAGAQQYEFDLAILAGAGVVGRTRVILENPALSVASYYRYYNSATACGNSNQTGSHVVWGNFSYNAICPSDGSGDFSQIRFCALTSNSNLNGTTEPATATDSTIDSSGGGCMPGEVLLGIATANTNPSTASASGGWVNTCPGAGASGMGASCSPTGANASTPASAWATCEAQTTSGSCGSAAPAAAAGWNLNTCTVANQATACASGVCSGGNCLATCTWAVQNGFNVGTVLAADATKHDAGAANDDYLRIRMEFDPSTPGDAVAPFLYSWNLDVDCVPAE